MVTNTKSSKAKSKRGPSIKHKLAFKEVVNGSSLSQAMRTVGYSESTSKRTNKLTNTLGWQQLVDKYISEESLIKVHKEGLKATRTIFLGEDGGTDEVPDFAVRHKYLETGYKVRGRLVEKTPPALGGNVFNFNFFNEDQLRKIATRTVDGDTTSTEEPH